MENFYKDKDYLALEKKLSDEEKPLLIMIVGKAILHGIDKLTEEMKIKSTLK